MKDVWLEDDRIEEGIHLNNIRAAITQMQSEEKDFFREAEIPLPAFWPSWHMDAWKMVAGPKDHTTNEMMRGSGLLSDLECFSTSKPRLPQVPGSRVIESDQGYREPRKRTSKSPALSGTYPLSYCLWRSRNDHPRSLQPVGSASMSGWCNERCVFCLLNILSCL